MHSVNSDMQVFALLESQFMDVQKEPKSTRKSSEPQMSMQVSICAEEYSTFIPTVMKFLRGFYTPQIKKSQVSHTAFFTCLNNSFD